jgi:hypothetical protein
MAEKTAPISLGYGTSAWSEYEAAQQEARDILAQRNNRLIDPVALAAAQGFLAPTKTGSFGESLGNVAGQMIPAVQAEEKRTMDMAKMRMELAQQGLQTTIQGQNAQQDADLLARMTGAPPKPAQAPAMPAPVQGGAPMPPAGGAMALPSAAPTPAAPPAPSGALAQAAPPVAQPAQVAQPSPLAQAVQQPAPQPAQPMGQQLFPAQPSTWDQDETAYAMAQRRSGKPMGEIMKEIDESRRKNKVVTQSGTTDIKTGQFFGQYDPTPTETFIHGYGSVKIPASEAKRLGLANSAEEYAAIAKQIMRGPTPATPPAPNATPTGVAPANAPAQVQRPTTAQAEANAEELKAEAKQNAENRAKRTSLAIDKLEPAIEVRAVAQSAKTLVNQEGGNLVVGIFEKPKISSIMGKMVDEGKFTPVGFRDAMVAANVAFSVDQKPDETSQQYTDRKQAILDRYYQMGTQVARAKFEASTLAKGQGAFSDGERKMFADTTINTKMSVSSMNKTADMLIARANFAESVGDKILDSNMSYDKFRRTPEYKKMLTAYEAKLQSIWSGNARPQSGGGRPDLDAAQANIDRQVQ